MSDFIRKPENGDVSETPFDSCFYHLTICKELENLYRCKNDDYGDSFHSTFEEEGFAMCRIRLSDKLNRFKNLTKEVSSEALVPESIRDTLLDLANYAIMTIIELDRM